MQFIMSTIELEISKPNPVLLIAIYIYNSTNGTSILCLEIWGVVVDFSLLFSPSQILSSLFSRCLKAPQSL